MHEVVRRYMYVVCRSYPHSMLSDWSDQNLMNEFEVSNSLSSLLAEKSVEIRVVMDTRKCVLACVRESWEMNQVTKNGRHCRFSLVS